jgi:hypothetical protein
MTENNLREEVMNEIKKLGIPSKDFFLYKRAITLAIQKAREEKDKEIAELKKLKGITTDGEADMVKLCARQREEIAKLKTENEKLKDDTSMKEAAKMVKEDFVRENENLKAKYDNLLDEIEKKMLIRQHRRSSPFENRYVIRESDWKKLRSTKGKERK